jgi:hypothetical protein
MHGRLQSRCLQPDSARASVAIHLPMGSYCPVCQRLFSSGFAIGRGAGATIEGCTSTCPKGHTGMVLDGTFEAYQGALNIKRAGKVTMAVLARIRQLAAEAQAGKKDHREALDEALELLPPETAAAVAKLGLTNPLAVLLLILTVLVPISEIASNVATTIQATRPNDPASNTTIIDNSTTITNNNDTTIINQNASKPAGDRKISRQQRRRAEQLEAKNRRQNNGDAGRRGCRTKNSQR